MFEFISPRIFYFGPEILISDTFTSLDFQFRIYTPFCRYYFQVHSYPWTCNSLTSHHRQQEALASMWMQIKQSICILKEKEPSPLSSKHLKLVDKFMYLGSNISFSESDVNICLAKALIAIDWSDFHTINNLSDKIKQYFIQAVAVSVLLYGCTTWTLTKCIEKRLNGNYTRMLWVILNKSWNNTPQNNSCTATYLPSQKPIK